MEPRSLSLSRRRFWADKAGDECTPGVDNRRQPQRLGETPPDLSHPLPHRHRANSEPRRKTTSFSHPALPLSVTGFIRLLQVSLDKQQPAQLQGRFKVVKVGETSPPFKAISYVWGDPTPVDRVWFNEIQHIEIAASASAILRRLATKAPSSYYWMDAICIDQSVSLRDLHARLWDKGCSPRYKRAWG